MAQILHSLNQEWSVIARGPAARRALMRWSVAHPVLNAATDLEDVIALGFRHEEGPDVRRALAILAPTEDLAARTLLQGLLGGLCNLARRIGRDADAVDDVVSLAWERIRTYPASRPGSVSGNVLLDVRKRYSRTHDTATFCGAIGLTGFEPAVEDRVVSNISFEELVATSRRSGVSNTALETIIRSRVVGESMTDLAAEQQIPLKVLWHRRWRAEARLRASPVAG